MAKQPTLSGQRISIRPLSQAIQLPRIKLSMAKRTDQLTVRNSSKRTGTLAGNYRDTKRRPKIYGTTPQRTR